MLPPTKLIPGGQLWGASLNSFSQPHSSEVCFTFFLSPCRVGQAAGDQLRRPLRTLAGAHGAASSLGAHASSSLQWTRYSLRIAISAAMLMFGECNASSILSTCLQLRQMCWM
jgi:hypothetical protein